MALISVGLATWLRLLLDRAIGDQFPYVTFFYAVLITASYGGLGPAMAAVALGGLSANYFLVPPRGQFGIEGLDQQVGMALYLSMSVGIALLGGGAARRAAANEGR